MQYNKVQTSEKKKKKETTLKLLHLKKGLFLGHTQEREEYAVYCDADVVKVQRRKHDLTECRCIFVVQYHHDESEVIFPEYLFPSSKSCNVMFIHPIKFCLDINILLNTLLWLTYKSICNWHDLCDLSQTSVPFRISLLLLHLTLIQMIEPGSRSVEQVMPSAETKETRETREIYSPTESYSRFVGMSKSQIFFLIAHFVIVQDHKKVEFKTSILQYALNEIDG